METETPMMLLFVCNRTDHSSITTDIRQILDIAYQDINEESMMPEQYNNWDIPKFSIRLNVPRLPQKSPLKTARLTIISESRGRRHSTWKLQNPTWRSSLSWPPTPTGWVWTQNILENLQNSRRATLGKDTPLSNCARLRRCIQGHLNFHLSSTSITINGIDNLDASEIVRNLTTGMKIARVSLRDMLYRIVLSNKSPLFLQLSQRPSGRPRQRIWPSGSTSRQPRGATSIGRIRTKAAIGSSRSCRRGGSTAT